jgi:ubiquitin-protein ligase E3 C
MWIVKDLMESEIRQCKTYEDFYNILNHPILLVCPFFLSFKLRLKLFERLTTTNRESIQGRNDGHSFRPGIHINIMRGRLIEDGLAHLNKLGANLRSRLIIQYVNAAGVAETGLDAGGLFKEFWSDLSNQSFNPNWALFKETEGKTHVCIFRIKPESSV